MADSGENPIDRAVHGDKTAFAELLERCDPTVRRRLLGRIPTRWQSVLSVDDVLQQTYADAIANIGEFNSRDEGAFAGWLATIAQRNLKDAVVALEAGKRGGDRWRVQLPTGMEPPGMGGTTPSRHVSRGEACKALERAIAQLPRAYARVVTMYDLEGRRVEEVADALQRSVGAVFMLRARAHERLHKLMGDTSKYFTR